MVETPWTTAKSTFHGGSTSKFAVHLIRGRWFSLFATFLIMYGAGATYLFGVYSKDIKSVLGYDQTTLNLLGFFKDLGANVGVLSGLIAEVTPTWFVLLVGAAMNFGGYFMIWLAITSRIAKPKVWQMCMYICIGANSQNFANTGALVTAVRNFPESRGVILGLLKGYTGLSGALMTQIYLAVYGNDSKSLVLLIAWLPAAVSVIFVYTIRAMKVVKHPNELGVFYHFLYVSIMLALFLMGITIAEKLLTFSRTSYAVSATVVCSLLFVPLFISIREELVVWANKTQHKGNMIITIDPPSMKDHHHQGNTETAIDPPSIKDHHHQVNTKITETTIDPPSINTKTTETTIDPPSMKDHHLKTTIDTLPKDEDQSKANEKPETGCFTNIFKKPERGEDYTILQALLSTDMLILFLATFCGLGSSLTAVDNLGQIGESLGYPTKTINTFVSLLSIWNYFGRIFSGFVSETLLVKYKFPRTLMMTLVLLLACAGHLLIAFPAPGSVYVASIIIGFSFGAQLPLIFAIISEIFGLKYYSTLFNCGQLASPIGSYILNVRVTGPIYDMEALKKLKKKGLGRHDVKELICMGATCYRLAFVILASVTFLGAMASLILVVRTREFYRGDIYKKFREAADAEERERELKSSS